METFSPSAVWKLALKIDLTCFIFGYSLGVFNSVSASIGKSYAWGENSEFLESFSSILLFGALFGALGTERTINRFGRKNGIVLCDIIYIIGSLVILLDWTWAIGISRFIVGVSTGMCMTIPPIYINEISPVELRGKVGTTMSLFAASGFIFAYGFGLVIELVGHFKWLWMAILLFPAVVACWQGLYLFYFVEFDTATWYISRDDKAKAKAALKIVYFDSEIEEQLEALECKLHGLDESLLGIEKVTYKSVLFSWKYNKMLRCGVILCSLQQLSGINTILFYSNDIFKDLHASSLMSRVLTLLMGFILLFSNALPIFLLKLFGRKTLLVSGQLFLAVDLFILAAISNSHEISPEVKSIFVMVFLIVFSYSFGATMWVYCSEVLNDKVFTIAATLNLLVDCICVYLFPVVFKALNNDISYIFYFYSSVMLLGAVYSMLDLIETRGLTKREAITLITS